MRALTWHGRHDVRVETVPDPEIVNPHDAILRVTSTAICGSDLHLYDGYIPGMRAGDILGHEFMGEVVETGSDSTLHKGDRVVVPFPIACGQCFFCKKQQFSCCDNTNPAETSDATETMYGYPMAGVFGYSHLTGGYAGGQAEYVRVPFSNVGPIVVPDHLEDDKVLFLSDILPTGWMAAENCEIEPGDTVAVWGCGPVGLFAIQSALIMGAHRVIAIDHYPTRLALAKELGAEILDYREVDVREALAEMTGGIGPDAVIDAVGLEAHGISIDNIADQVKSMAFLVTDRAHAFREAVLSVRKGGRVSVPGVYGGFADRELVGEPAIDPGRRLHGEGPDHEDRPDPRSALPETAARPHRAGEGRHHLPHLAPRAARAGGGHVQALARRPEPIHQDRAEDRNGRSQGRAAGGSA